jgi:hypothetical protein
MENGSSPISEDRLDEVIRSSIWFALNDRDRKVRKAVTSLRRWSRSGRSFKMTPDSPPQIDRLLWAFGMFGSSTYFSGFTSVQQCRLVSFLKAIPFAYLTVHLPAIAELSIVLRKKFALQLNLIYVLLRTYRNCVDVLGICRECFDSSALPKIEAALGFVDKLYQTHQPLLEADTVYERLTSFVRRAIEIHNSLILRNDGIGSVDFRYIQENFMIPYTRLENTILPALVHQWESLAGTTTRPWELFVSSIRFLSASASDNPDSVPIIFVDDPDMIVRFQKIFFDPTWDFLGFTRDDFLRSLAKFWEQTTPKDQKTPKDPTEASGRFACRRALLTAGVSPPSDTTQSRWEFVQCLFDERETDTTKLVELMAAEQQRRSRKINHELAGLLEFDPQHPFELINKKNRKVLHQFLVALKLDVESVPD